MQMELFASEPMIQTPIGATIDGAGRLLVIESHTHFRPKDWKGPAHDQIVWLRDTDGDGKADARQVYFGETDMTMDIAAHPDGSIYASTRDEVLRMRDENDDGAADAVERKIVWLESEGNYPHNGLSGLAFDSRGQVWLGMGENLGAGYIIRGSDGTEIKDQGEGGNIWRFSKYGKGLKRMATGFWNAFGVCVDPQDNVFATDNDPDSSPPCRLHHVVEAGDYGYQFRYGRSGLHPFISWNGQRAGTLPMLAGTGESPCDVIFYAPRQSAEFRGLSDSWHGTLLVASWVDHRIESYRLTPSAGTFKAERKILVQGGVDFRPVAFAVAADGSIYVTDWVRREYELHGQGRVWKISAKAPRVLDASPVVPFVQDDAAKLRERVLHGAPPTAEEAVAWLALKEPYLFSAAIDRLSREPVLTRQLYDIYLQDARQRAGLILATRRGTEREEVSPTRMPNEIRVLIERGLVDADAEVILAALHWISDERMAMFRGPIEILLKDRNLKPDVYYAALTALARFESENPTEPELVRRLKKDITSPGTLPAHRRLALEILPDRDRNLGAGELEPVIAATTDADTRLWLVHLLGTMRDRNKNMQLRKLAFDETQEPRVRAAATAHLEITEADHDPLVNMTASDNADLQRASLQALQGVKLTDAQRDAVRISDQPELRSLASRIIGKPFTGARRPSSFDDIKGWQAYLHKLPGEASIENGRRVFASPKLGMCSTCHRADGIGSSAGPDLTQIAAQTDRSYILESILKPNRNLAPQWETFQITTTDGQSRTAFQIAERGGNHVYADLTGQTFDVKIDDIVNRERLTTSIMPEGLVSKLTDEELRDLLAFLSSAKH